ncbi:TraR/DksA C4-type zinc finger protein [Stenotrophomonas maltophilia]|uniref:TraR/DksA C4-type zinc finger protein n=1 Tax=Stenotrophomonas maltophilia TaxID=40324 RepID=UPI003D2F822B
MEGNTRVQDDADMAGEVDARAWEEHERNRLAREAYLAGPPAILTPMDCVDCGASIPEARQRAVPRTRRCVTCAGALETR